jgi:hypothetical protein
MIVKNFANSFEIREGKTFQRRRIDSDFRIQAMFKETVQVAIIKHSKRNVNLNFAYNILH